MLRSISLSMVWKKPSKVSPRLFLSRFDELRHGSVTSGYVGCIYTITTFEFDIWISTDEISGETEADHSLLPYTIVIH